MPVIHSEIMSIGKNLSVGLIRADLNHSSQMGTCKVSRNTGNLKLPEYRNSLSHRRELRGKRKGEVTSAVKSWVDKLWIRMMRIMSIIDWKHLVYLGSKSSGSSSFWANGKIHPIIGSRCCYSSSTLQLRHQVKRQARAYWLAAAKIQNGQVRNGKQSWRASGFREEKGDYPLRRSWKQNHRIIVGSKGTLETKPWHIEWGFRHSGKRKEDIKSSLTGSGSGVVWF